MMAGQKGGPSSLSFSTQDAARDRLRSQIVQSNQPGLNTTPAPISSAKEICFQHRENVTMQAKIMLALTAVVIACTCALAEGNGIRDNRYTSTAQYCVPQVEDGTDAFRVYC
jgi:hypothetical protein